MSGKQPDKMSDHHQATSVDSSKSEKIAQRSSRKPCFSDDEIRVLRDKIDENKHILCDGKTNNFNEKGRIWSNILESVNFVCYRENGCLRTIKEIKAKWKRLKVLDGKASIDNMSDIQLLISQCTSDSLAREELELTTESSPLMNHMTESSVTLNNGHENRSVNSNKSSSSSLINEASISSGLLKNGPATTTTTTAVKQEITTLQSDSDGDNDDEPGDFRQTKVKNPAVKVNRQKVLSPVKQPQLPHSNDAGVTTTSPRKCKFDDYMTMIRDLTAEDYFGKTVAFMLKEIHNPKRKRVMQAQIMTILAQD